MSVQKLLLCRFHWKPRPWGVSLEFPKVENIPQVLGNGAEVGQNHDARKVVSVTLGVLKWSEVIFRPRSSKGSVQKLLLCPFHWKPRQSGVSLESPWLEPKAIRSKLRAGMKNIPQVPQNRAKVCKNHDARKAVSASLLVLRLSGARFRPRSSKVSVQKVLLCPFHCKPRPSGVSLDSPGLENIAQVRGNRAEFCQNHDARKAVSATL